MENWEMDLIFAPIVKKMEKDYLGRQKAGERVDEILKDFLNQEMYQTDPIALVKIASLEFNVYGTIKHKKEIVRMLEKHKRKMNEEDKKRLDQIISRIGLKSNLSIKEKLERVNEENFSIVKFMEQRRIFGIRVDFLGDKNKLVIEEKCDEHYHTDLTRKMCLHLSKYFSDLAEIMNK